MNLEQFIEELDFNRYEKATIIFLATRSQATATQIIKQTKVPQGRIYSILNQLIKKGIVKVIPSRPKEYKIDKVKETLTNYIQSKRNTLKQQLEEIKQLDEPPKTLTLSQKKSTVMFTGRKEHVDAITHLRNSAKKEILQIAPLFVGSFNSQQSIIKARQRGIKIKIITLEITLKNKRNIQTAINAGAQIRVIKTKDLLSTVIIDNKKFLLGIDAYHKNEERMTLLSKNRAVLETITKTFDELWKKAKPIKN